MGTTTLNCRLLCASSCAYFIDSFTGEYAPVEGNKFSPAVAFLQTPTPVSAFQINACLIGENADGIIVAFRGTLPPRPLTWDSAMDWLQDFIAIPIARPDVPGMVHVGIYEAVQSIIADVAKAVISLRTKAQKVYVTGHSKGGGMASIGAWILRNSFGIPIEQVVTFASLKPGDPEFKAKYELQFPRQIRYENFDDVVPLLPPSSAIGKHLAKLSPKMKAKIDLTAGFDYEPVGTLQFIESAAAGFQVIPDHFGLSLERILETAVEVGKALITTDFTPFADAHTLGCGFGYNMGVCQESVCGPQIVTIIVPTP